MLCLTHEAYNLKIFQQSVIEIIQQLLKQGQVPDSGTFKDGRS